MQTDDLAWILKSCHSFGQIKYKKYQFESKSSGSFASSVSEPFDDQTLDLTGNRWSGDNQQSAYARYQPDLQRNTVRSCSAFWQFPEEVPVTKIDSRSFWILLVRRFI